MTIQDFCDDCIHLSPKEHEQTDNRIPHECDIYEVPMYHFNQHPHLPRPIFCNDYQKEERYKINLSPLPAICIIKEKL